MMWSSPGSKRQPRTLARARPETRPRRDPYMCTCMYIYIYIHIHVYVYKYIYIYFNDRTIYAKASIHREGDETRPGRGVVPPLLGFVDSKLPGSSLRARELHPYLYYYYYYHIHNNNYILLQPRLRFCSSQTLRSPESSMYYIILYHIISSYIILYCII